MTPTFSTWDRATLDKFALEAYLRLQQQQDQLEQLRGDLKDAIVAYRLRNLSDGHIGGSGVANNSHLVTR
jgi:hypothetical protein